MPKGLEIVGCGMGVGTVETFGLPIRPLGAEGSTGVDIGVLSAPVMLPESLEEAIVVKAGTVMDEEAQGLVVGVDGAVVGDSPFGCGLARGMMGGPSCTTGLNCGSVVDVESERSVDVEIVDSEGSSTVQGIKP